MNSALASVALDGSPDELISRGEHHDDAEFDITAMIDLVFLMNLYFLVTFITAALGELELPTANHCAALDGEKLFLNFLSLGNVLRNSEHLRRFARNAQDHLPGRMNPAYFTAAERENSIFDVVRHMIFQAVFDRFFDLPQIFGVQKIRPMLVFDRFGRRLVAPHLLVKRRPNDLA